MTCEGLFGVYGGRGITGCGKGFGRSLSTLQVGNKLSAGGWSSNKSGMYGFNVDATVRDSNCGLGWIEVGKFIAGDAKAWHYGKGSYLPGRLNSRDDSGRSSRFMLVMTNG
ncbi:unnamed protein product [Cuscuta epithymum]|uniref:Uncharacterized protein n=1 Tax=Cuscuta epithymum TaxID=186058 RepID=A0AAV0G9C6_9ASTE|nr:unnamed protein product [Cuscuta epithymum]